MISEADCLNEDIPPCLPTQVEVLGISDHPNGGSDCDLVLFKRNRIYRHQLMRLNYTTYDVRRAQDGINFRTSHCNIMVLSEDSNDTETTHPFLYGRVLGIYHVNVVYNGPGMVNYQPRRMEFLWVRWFQYHSDKPLAGWDSCRLDQLRFPSVASESAFGFVDPVDVVRGCHIIPRFARGQSHPDGKGLSKVAQDSGDWFSYYVGR